MASLLLELLSTSIKEDLVHEIEADILVMQADDPDCENREQLLQDAIKLYRASKKRKKILANNV